MLKIADKILKVFYIGIAILSIFIYLNMRNSLVVYASAVFKNVEVYQELFYSTLAILLFPFFGSLLFFSNIMEKSKYNTYRIEKGLSDFFKSLKIVTIPYKVYYLFIIMYGALFFYSLLEITTIIATVSQLYQDVNLITMEKTAFSGFALKRTLFLIGINVFFFIMFLIMKSEKQNKDFLYSYFVLPLFLLFAEVGQKILLPENIKGSGLILFEGNYISNTNIAYPVYAILGLLSVLTLIYCLKICRSSKKIKNTLIGLGLGLVSFKISIMVGSLLFCYSPTANYFYSNENIIEVELYGNKYTINQTLLSEMDSMEDEFMVETFVGLSQHNATNSLVYMLSNDFKGDQEKARKLAAKATLTNLRLFKEKKDKLEEYLRMNKVSMSTAVNIAIPYVLYEASPLEHQERVLESVMKGNYQEAVDFYISDALNAAKDKYPELLNNKNDTRNGSYGHEVTQNIIFNLLRNNLAELDFNKINDKEKRLKLEEFYKNSDYNYTKEWVSKEKSEQWFKMFDI